VPRKKAFPEEETVRVHLVIPRRLYQEAWKIAAERFEKPVGKLCKIVSEALEQYIKNYRKRQRGRER